MKNFEAFLLVILLMFSFGGCSAYYSVATFPSADELFVTTGDGNIQKPYTPIGQIIYSKTGARIPIPILSAIPIEDIDPDVELRTKIYDKVKAMGGDGMINLSLNWQPPTPFPLSLLFGNGGTITVYGTVIKR
ncbi:MAG: hypothetical protein AUJ54_02495 [Ignavibacteria bacterium CG1_02_37_35]|nr:hypothetical protein [Ignavibacteria bacterium]OIO23027.1 MAG: hypothetical protein AUJ54_02495 [Ignavibacteria bacterium CG1_02_37_35]PJC58111.1 MAG: hypothetical protein CO025_10110 [Ignavibacteria bacterium CG_4_9_14_0_2_um_filter_37_13]